MIGNSLNKNKSSTSSENIMKILANNKESRTALLSLSIIAILFISLAICLNLIQWHYATSATIILLILCFITIIIGVLLIFRMMFKEIADLSTYINRIIANDFSYDLRNNREGYFSILRNDIYKITMMLLESSKKEQQEKEYLSNSLAEISHQLKTPLTSMLVMTELLKEELPEEKKQEFLVLMEKQLSRLQWITTSLLKISKLDAKTVQLNKVNVNVSDIVQKVVEQLAIPIEVKELSISVIGDNDVFFVGDRNWTIEALINIVKNCVEHTPFGGEITVTYSKTPLYTQITIKDNGKGIAKGDIMHIFQRFYKGQNSHPDSVGIGLAMAKAIIENQGGYITVKSEENKGTEFDIKFYIQFAI